MFRERQCKIVATVGPASSAPSMLEQLHLYGVDVFRLNFSHGEHESHGSVLKAIREAEKRSGFPIAVIADLQGPKIRCGQFEKGSLALKAGKQYTLVASERETDPHRIPVPHPELLEALEVGDPLLLDDGKLRLEVTAKEGETVRVKAIVPGLLKDRKGINVPARPLPISALTEKDRKDLAFALDVGVDYIALSFVQSPNDIEEARTLIGDRVGILAKIEKPSAVRDIEKIVELSDAIMIARGDLGVEMPPEQVPVIQRRIVRICRAAGKPVIVATHMLESMVAEATPTRAEASDIATAVFQGADAVMLSAESAVGRHPTAAVAVMDRVIKAAEADYDYRANPRNMVFADLATADAISLAASYLADAPDVQSIVAYTKTGSTARRVSRERPRPGLLALTPDVVVGRKLRLSWGIVPVISEDVTNFESMLTTAENAARDIARAKAGDRVIILTGYPFGRPGKTNTIKISRLD